MTKRYPIIYCLIITTLVLASPICAEDSTGTIHSLMRKLQGDAGFGMVYLMPQGSFNDNAGDGGRIYGRLTSRKTGVEFLSLWLTGSGSLFGKHSQIIDIEAPDDPSTTIEAKREIQQYVLSLYLGLQVNSTSNRATIRPRIGTGLGFNIFITDSRYFWGNYPTDEDRNSSEVDQVLGRWGWHSEAGVDIIIKGSYGMSIDLTYDQIWYIDITDGPAEFLGLGIGLVYTIR
ncbi:MAG: hypothetical protein GY841_14845 [FCB group bacterium]|nr:hypothetical protein [FCB group bacterium]